MTSARASGSTTSRATCSTRDAETLRRRALRDRADVEPTIFNQAIKGSGGVRRRDPGRSREGKSGEELFFDLALEDITRAADLFRPIWDRTNSVDGWVVARGVAPARLRREKDAGGRGGSL